MKKITSVIISFSFMVGLGVSLSACSDQELKLTSPGINQVEPNKKFVIKLPEDHSKKESWQLQSGFNTSVIQQLNEVWHGDAKGIYFNLQSLAAGQTTLSFVKRIYSDTVDTKHFIIKVTPQ